MPVYEFASEIIRRFDLLGAHQNGHRRNVEAVFQDPANKSQTGTGHSVRDQINEVLAECGLAAIDGSDDRIGGWQLLFQLLARGQWLIADTCPLLIAAIPSRVHDPRRPGDLVKVGGDPLDDAMDAARYGIYSFITATEKPPELVLRDELRALAEQGDLTSAMIRYQQRTAELEYSGRPAVLGRYGRRR